MRYLAAHWKSSKQFCLLAKIPPSKETKQISWYHKILLIPSLQKNVSKNTWEQFQFHEHFNNWCCSEKQQKWKILSTQRGYKMVLSIPLMLSETLNNTYLILQSECQVMFPTSERKAKSFAQQNIYKMTTIQHTWGLS